MSRGRKSILFEGSDWEKVFNNSVGVYVQIINLELRKTYKLKPLSKYIKILGGYAFKSSQYKKQGIPVIRISDFSNEKIVLTDCVYYDESDGLSKYELKEGDIIIALTGGTIAKLAIVQEGLGKLYLNQRVGKFEALNPDEFESEYVYWIARSVQSIIKDLAWGAAIPNVSPKQIEALDFPLPDKKIQKGIISFLNDLKNQEIDSNRIYFKKYIDNEIIKLQENQVSGNNISTALTHQLDLVKQLRQAFLREAMQGKLTQEWRESHPDLVEGEPASELLAKIKAEKEQLIKEKKIKKQKPLPPITENEIPFEIPENWVWCRLREVCSKIGSGSTPKGSNYSNDGIPFFRSQNVHNDGLVYDDIKFISEDVHQKMNGTTVLTNDVLLNITGGSLGRCALVPSDFEEGNVSQHVSIIRPVKLENSYLHKIILSPLIQGYIFNSTTGAGREGLPKYNLEQFVIPLPPLSEQQRIVSKLDKLMQYCDKLEQSIDQSLQQAESLRQSILKRAFEGKLVPHDPNDEPSKV
ncbi:MAG: restriction endonuclease subunit S [Bacteroidales bacterium]|nr:restriction endonuclease subunit S [Bacteroidales bacterium]